MRLGEVVEVAEGGTCVVQGYCGRRQLTSDRVWRRDEDALECFCGLCVGQEPRRWFLTDDVVTRG